MKMQGVPEDQLDQTAKQVAQTALPQIAEEFVMLHALRDAAAKAGIVCSDEDVEEEFAKVTSQLPPGLTLEEAFERNGINADELKKQIAETLPVKKFFDDLAKDAAPSDEDIAKFYEEKSESFKTPEQVRASHILVKVDSGASDEDKAAAKAKIEGLLAQIKDGADFAELAKANSDCPSKEEGGDLGFFGHGQMVPEFDAAAFALEDGGISDIVETQFGFHVIKKTGSKEAGVTPLDEVKDDIAKFLENQKKGEIINGYIKEFRKNLVFEKNEKLAPIFTDDEQDDAPTSAE
jgi:peptidyl-prolyl cis-trans isomerase C